MTRPSVLVPLQAEIASSYRPARHASYPRPENVGQKTMPVFRFSSSSVSRSDRANSSQSAATVLQAGPKQKRRACKPGSVPWAPAVPTVMHHLSGPAVAGRLLQPTRRLEPRSRRRSWTGRPPAARLCSWRGLPCRRCCQRRGGLLPHLFTLTGGRPLRERRRQSVFCGTLCPRRCQAPRPGHYPAPCPSGARTFLHAVRPSARCGADGRPAAMRRSASR